MLDGFRHKLIFHFFPETDIDGSEAADKVEVVNRILDKNPDRF